MDINKIIVYGSIEKDGSSFIVKSLLPKDILLTNQKLWKK